MRKTKLVTPFARILSYAFIATLVIGAAPRAHGASQQPSTYTSPLDITGMRVQLVASAPDRNTGAQVNVALPVGLLGPKMSLFFSTPLSAQLDLYWSSIIDPKTGKTPRDQACNGPDGIVQQVQKAVHQIGSSFNAYDISCNLATNGSLLLKQVGSTQYIGYELTHNTVDFKVTTPGTCHAGHGTPLCPNDPHFNVTFAVQLETLIRAPDVCHIVAENGNVFTSAVSIDSANFTGDLVKLSDDLFLGHKFTGAERAIQAVQKQMPLPLDKSFKELRDSDGCTGKNAVIRRTLVAFRNFDVTVQPHQGLVFHMGHAGIATPTVSAPDPSASSHGPSQPTFTHPMISTNRPSVAAGGSLQVSGQYFPPDTNLSTALPLTMAHGGYGEGSMILGGVCFAGATELQWGPMNGPARVERLPGDAQGACAKNFDAANLTPRTAYQFRARDCDPITCSPWSAPLRVTTAPTDPNHGTVALTIDAAGGPTVSDRISATSERVALSPAAAGPSSRVSHSSVRSTTSPGISATSRAETTTATVSSISESSRTAAILAAVAKSEIGSASITPQGTFVTTVTIPAGASPGTHTIRATGSDSVAEVAVTVSAANAGSGGGALMMVALLRGETGCPNHPIPSTATGMPFMLFGTGLPAGPVTVHLDTPTGPTLGTANVLADGTFCQQMSGPAANLVGNHQLVAVQNGAAKAQLSVTFVAPSIIR